MDADKIIKRFETLEGKRGAWEGVWQQCADYVMPRLGRESRSAQHIFDSTAPLALGRFAAAMESFLTPRTQKWHGLVTGYAELDKVTVVARYLEGARDLIFSARYAPEANFANQMMEAYIALGVHGTAVIHIDEAPGRGLRYQCIPVQEVYLDEDAAGRVDTVFRWYKLTARQAVQEFGDELPEKIRRDAEDPQRMDTRHDFIHAVFPRKDFDQSRADAKNMPIASVHLAKDERHIVRESGFRTMPYAVSRFQVAAGEVYGRSPAMEVMADIVQVNAMKKTMLRAAEKMVNPPLLVPEDDLLNAFSLKAGSINYGGLDDQGRQRVVPLQIGGNLPIGLEMIEQSRKVINEAFYINLFQILVETPQKTATEVMERAQEKAQLLAPAMGRQQSELLRTIIGREVDILIQSGVFPPAPPELAQAGAEVFPKYETAMAKALDSQDGVAILQAVGALVNLAQIDPGVVNIVDALAAGRAVWQGFGAPAKVTRSEEEAAELKRQKEAAQQQAMMMQQAGAAIDGLQGLAGAEQKLSQARAAGQGAKQEAGHA